MRVALRSCPLLCLPTSLSHQPPPSASEGTRMHVPPTRHVEKQRWDLVGGKESRQEAGRGRNEICRGMRCLPWQNPNSHPCEDRKVSSDPGSWRGFFAASQKLMAKVLSLIQPLARSGRGRTVGPLLTSLPQHLGIWLLLNKHLVKGRRQPQWPRHAGRKPAARRS